MLLLQAAQKHQRAVSRMSPEAMALLQGYDFPGNVRELKNALEDAVIVATGDEVHEGDCRVRSAPRAPRRRLKLQRAVA